MQRHEGSERPRLAIVGSTMIDQVAYVQRVPEAGETVVGDRFQMGFGGKGANQAVMARRLGADVWMVTSVGEDVYGQMVLDNFARFGVDTTHVQVVADANGVAPIWVEPDGTNRIIVVPGANAHVTAEQAASAISALGDLDVVIGQLEIPQAATIGGFRAAREVGAVTVLNPAPAAPIHQDLFEATDWLVPNEVEFAELSGGEEADDDAALQRFADRTGTRLLVTLGEEGVAVVGPAGRVSRIPSPKVTATDTTGAGDAFVGAFAFGLARFRAEEAASRLGVLCASDSVTREGTQSSFADADRCRTLVEQVEPGGAST